MPNGDKTDGQDSYRDVSRRHVITTGSVGVAGAIAGCLGGNDDDGGNGNGGNGGNGNGGNGGNGGTAIEPKYKLAEVSEPPTELHFNFYNPQQRTQRQFVWDKLGETHYGLGEGELFYPMLAESWEMDEDELTFTVNLREDTTWWHNDEQVTSQDVWTMVMMEYYSYESFHEATDSFEMPDDKTFVMHLNGETNTTLMEQQVITRVLATPYSHFGEWAEDLSDALDDRDEYDAIMEGIVTERIEDPIGNGPFKIVDTNRERYDAEVHEGHWATDDWLDADSEGATVYQANSDRARQFAFSDDIDTLGGVDEAILNNIPDHFERFESPSTAGFGLGLNMNVEPLDDVRVRKALMHAINRENVAGNMGPSQEAPEHITGISATQDTYIPEGEVRDQYSTYPHDPERAEELLEEAGLTKEDGTWLLEDGSEWELPLTFAAGQTGFVQGGQTIVGQLEQFGIKAEMETIDDGQFHGDAWSSNDFTAFMMWWGGWRPYPINGLSASLYDHRHDNIGYPALEDNGGEIDVPMPIGDEDGSMETIDVGALVNELSNSADTDRNMEIIRLLAWVYNQTLPELPMAMNNSVRWFDADSWNLPSEDSGHRSINIPHYSLTGTGLLTPKTE